MYTADPKKNPDAKFIPEQTFEEAEEASRRGAFVIQADCIEPAKNYHIPIYLRNCFRLECPGTRIGLPVQAIKPQTCIEEKSSNEQTVDHLMESIESQRVSEQIYPLCSDSETVTRHRASSHADEQAILEIIV